MARGHGEMEGLAVRYEESAYALAAGYGLVRHDARAAPAVDLPRLADSLAARGQTITPRTAPRITPSRWRPASLHPPGYTLFLLGIYRVVGEPVSVWARVLQAILDAGACLLVFLIGRRFLGTAAGLWAAWGAALFLPLAFLATSRVGDALTPALYTLVFWLFVRALATRRVLWFAATGLALGVLCLVRPDYYLYPLFLIAAAALFLRRWRPALAGGAALVAVMFLVVLPWGIRNARVNGRFDLGTTAAGMTLLQSVAQFPNPYGIQVPDQWYVDRARAHGFDDVDDPGADRLFRREFVRIVHADPGFVAGEMVRRIPLAIAPLYRWGYVNHAYEIHSVYAYREREGLGPWAAFRAHPLALLSAYWDRALFGVVSLALFAACVAFAVLERRRWRAVVVVLVPYAYVVAAHLLIYMSARLLVPAVFCQLVALAYVIERVGRRRPVRLWTG